MRRPAGMAARGGGAVTAAGRATRVMRAAVSAFFGGYHCFTSVAALLALPFSAAVLASEAAAPSSATLRGTATRLRSVFAAAGFPPSPFFALLEAKLAQTVFTFAVTLPFALTFLLLAKACVAAMLRDRDDGGGGGGGGGGARRRRPGVSSQGSPRRSRRAAPSPARTRPSPPRTSSTPSSCSPQTPPCSRCSSSPSAPPTCSASPPTSGCSRSPPRAPSSTPSPSASPPSSATSPSSCPPRSPGARGTPPCSGRAWRSGAGCPRRWRSRCRPTSAWRRLRRCSGSASSRSAGAPGGSRRRSPARHSPSPTSTRSASCSRSSSAACSTGAARGVKLTSSESSSQRRKETSRLEHWSSHLQLQSGVQGENPPQK